MVASAGEGGTDATDGVSIGDDSAAKEAKEAP